MKYFCPLALTVLLAGCAITPEDKEAAHQRQLEKEARENFIALKAQEHPGRPVVLHDEVAVTTPQPKPQPKPQPQSQPHMSSSVAKRPSATPARTKVVSMHAPHAAPVPYHPPASKPKASRYAEDTIYYWQAQSIKQRASPRQKAAELKYARSLAKRPENLTPEERTFAHEHY